MSGFSRFEFLLPLQFNNGRPREGKAVSALFPASHRTPNASRVAGDPATGAAIQLRLCRAAANRQRFVKLNLQHRTRFRQMDIWLTLHPIESL